MKNLLKVLLIASGLVFISNVFAADMDVNTDKNDMAIKGYDPVAYFTLGKATKGSINYTTTHKGAIYQFVSEDNRNLFDSNPDKYAPQFGGYCAFGVSKEKKFDTDPTAWKIIEDKLYLNLNSQVQQRWLKDSENLIKDAKEYWREIAFVPASDL